jgi:sterol desaturase/sphingolipid hydroxylase (fatty acid hydroxylase superfamily)
VIATTLIFVAGLFAWTLLEYIIHGVLAHSHRTFVTPLHNEHHVDPRAVFAMRAYIPTAIVLIVLLTIFGMAPGMIFLFGMVAGFAVYEYVHYRIHFARPASAIEARLRARHLAHHVKEPDAIFGVTTRFWDVVFRTEPAPELMRELATAGASVTPLSGSSNLGRVIRSRIVAS